MTCYGLEATLLDYAGGLLSEMTTDRSSSPAAAGAATAERSGTAGRTVVGLSKVSLLPADKILYGEGCPALPSLSSSSLMIATAAAKVNAYLNRSAVLLPRRRIHDVLL